MNRNPHQQTSILIPRWITLCLSLILTGCTLPEARTGDRLLAEGNYDGAVAAYRVAAKKEPFNDAVRQGLEQARTKAGARHYEQGMQALEGRRLPEALQELNAALSLAPGRADYQHALGEALRLKEARERLQAAEKLRSAGRLEEAGEAYEQAVQLDPSLAAALQGITAVTQQQKLDRTLGQSTQPITLRFQNARLKEVFEILARAGGINVVFDKDFKDDPISIFIKDTPFPDALSMILSSNNLFARRVGPDTLLIIPNSKQKQDQYQDQMIRTFYLSNAKAKEMVNALRTMLDSKRVYVNEPLNSIVIRDQPDKLRLAERIIQANDRRDAEVEFDIEILEVDRTVSQQLGLDYAKSLGVGAVPPPIGGATVAFGSAVQWTYRQLTSLGPDSYVASLPTTAVLNFLKTDTNTKTLANPKLRVANNKKGSINVGDKNPILLSTTNVLPGQAATGAVPTTSTVTSIEFKDTGVKLTIEPTVHLQNEVSLKLTIDVTTLGDKVILQASPQISQFKFGTRTAETTLNIKDLETVVLAGLIQDQEQKIRTGVPYLMDVPWIGSLFTSFQTNTTSTEIILTLTPKVIRNVTTPEVDTQAFWSGTETNYATVPLFTDATRTVATRTVFRPETAPDSGVPASAGRPGGAPGPASAGGPPSLTLRPEQFAAFVGQEFALDLVGEHLEGVGAVPLLVTYDAEGLEFQRVQAGPAVAPGGAAVTAILGTGQLEVRLGPPGQPLPATGVLGTLVFKARKTGTVALEVKPNPSSSPNPQTGQVAARGQVLVR
jgi:general secretion pathway protein D